MTIAQSDKHSVGDVTRRVLIHCLKGRWDAGALDQARGTIQCHEIDWGAFYEDAQAEGVASILYDNIRDQDLVPDWLEQRLRLIYYDVARRNLIRLVEVEHVVTDLRSASIPLILLKGVAFAESVYDNIALRPMVDADLLIQEEDLPKVLSILTTLGYDREKVARFAALQDVHANEITVRKPDVRESTLELHWSLFWFPYYRQVIPMTWFWETARPMKMREASAMGLGLEAQIIHACGHLLHHQAVEGHYKLLWLYDIAELITRSEGNIDWNIVLSYGHRFGLVLAIKPVLLRIYDLWRRPIPQDVLVKIKGWQPSARERRAYTWLQKLEPSFDGYAMTSLMSLPDLGSRARFVWRTLMFPSSNFMKNRYQIEHPVLVPLYYPYRWLAGAFKAFRMIF